MRSVDEWKGKTDDAAIPPRVRLRVFEKHGGVCCLSGRKIRPGDAWDLHHVHSLSLGGEHRESNLAPALKDAHRRQTSLDRKLQAKSDRIRKRHLGIKKSGRKIPGSKGSGWRRPLSRNGGQAYRIEE